MDDGHRYAGGLAYACSSRSRAVAASALRLALHVPLQQADQVARLLVRRLLAPAKGSSEEA